MPAGREINRQIGKTAVVGNIVEGNPWKVTNDKYDCKIRKQCGMV